MPPRFFGGRNEARGGAEDRCVWKCKLYDSVEYLDPTRLTRTDGSVFPSTRLRSIIISDELGMENTCQASGLAPGDGFDPPGGSGKACFPRVRAG